MNTGILGGTFDPPHLAHLIVAQDAALALGLDRILFIPAAIPPHKRDVAITPAALRRRMLELALEGNPRFAMDCLELERSGASFTVDTLRTLAAREPETAWTLLIGADQYAEFDTWHEPATILELAAVAVLTRAGQTAADPLGDETHAVVPQVGYISDSVRAVNVTRMDISSTHVRSRVGAGLPIRYMVPATVEQFIFEKKLYVRNGTPTTG